MAATLETSVLKVPHSRPWITAADQSAVAACLASGQVASGPLVRAFEAAVASAMGQRHAVCADSGTAALTLGLRSMRLPRGGEVVVPTYVCEDVAVAVRAAGLVPVWCDVGELWCMTVDSVRAALTPRSVAVIVVHQFGRVADIAGIAALGLPVVSDACQAFGARNADASVSSGASATVVSFHATKCFTTGEGGALLTDDAALAATARAVALGDDAAPYPTRFSDLQAALGLSQLSRYPEMLARRALIAARWNAVLTNHTALAPSPQSVGATPAFRYTTCSADSFDEVAAALAQHGIVVRRGVDSLRHRATLPDDRFPGASRLWAQTISLPAHASLTDDEWCGMESALRQLDGLC